MADAVAPGAYSSLRVLDFTHIVAGPVCTRMLADHGAEVIKIESLQGDMMRHLPYEYAPLMTTQFAQYDAGKRSVAMNLREPECQDIVMEMVEWADVVVENFRPGAMERLGLPIPEMMKRNPRLVACSISAFGAVGPASDIAGFGFIAEARSGLMFLTGDGDDPPRALGTALADMNAGVHALGAVGAALYSRSITGRGTHIDLSSYDALVSIIDHAIPLHNITHGEKAFGRYGMYHPMVVPGGVMQTADGEYIAYSCGSDEKFAALAKLIGRPELAEDPKYATGPARVEVQDELYALIAEWAATIPNVEQIIERLAEADMVGAWVRKYPETAEDEHLIARGSLAPVELRDVGEVYMPVTPHPMSGLNVAWQGDPPRLGEHSREVLVDQFGVSPEHFDALVAKGAIGVSGGEAED
jgi:crotonobetainyl-CoA:carnitine CoA-transferase CaiB-like acyl-CoA transferase